MILAHVAEAIDLTANTHPEGQQVIVAGSLVTAHGGSHAVVQLKYGHAVCARGIGR